MRPRGGAVRAELRECPLHDRLEFGGGVSRRATAAFSLIEVIVALTIVAVLAAVAIPTLTGFRDETVAREPLAELASMVAEVRDQAASQRRAFEILFDEAGFYAMPRFDPSGDRRGLRERFERLQNPPDVQKIERQSVERTEIVAADPRGGFFANGGFVQGRPSRPRPDSTGGGEGFGGWSPPYLRRYDFPEGVVCEVLFWGDPEWTAVEREVVSRWVIQPSGMLRPAKVRFSLGESFFEAGFDLLTGELVNERSSVVPPKKASGEGGQA